MVWSLTHPSTIIGGVLALPPSGGLWLQGLDRGYPHGKLIPPRECLLIPPRECLSIPPRECLSLLCTTLGGGVLPSPLYKAWCIVAFYQINQSMFWLTILGPELGPHIFFGKRAWTWRPNSCKVTLSFTNLDMALRWPMVTSPVVISLLIYLWVC